MNVKVACIDAGAHPDAVEGALLLGACGHELLHRVLPAECLDLGQVHCDEQEGGRRTDGARKIEVGDIPRPLAHGAVHAKAAGRGATDA